MNYILNNQIQQTIFPFLNIIYTFKHNCSKTNNVCIYLQKTILYMDSMRKFRTMLKLFSNRVK